MPVIIHRRLLDVISAAEYLSIGKTLLYQLAAEGKIPSIKIKSRRRRANDVTPVALRAPSVTSFYDYTSGILIVVDRKL